MTGDASSDGPPAPGADDDALELLGFVAPGLAHAIAGPLQVLQVQAALLGTTPAEIARAREAMQRAVASGERLLDLMRCFTKAARTEKPVQVGLVLGRLVDVLRYSLRDQGLAIELLHASNETPVPVPLGPFAKALTRVVRVVAAAVPIGWRGALLVDLHRQSAAGTELLVRARSAPGFLPFTVPLERALSAVTAAAAAEGVTVSWDPAEGAVRIVVPACKDVAARV